MSISSTATLLVTLLTFFVVPMLKAEMRGWTNSSGKTIQAELVDVTEGKAVLNMNEQNFPVIIASLSAVDQEFIKEWQKGAPVDTAKPAVVEGNWDSPWPKLVSVDVTQDIEDS